MEDGGVDRTVIDCQQNQLGQIADFPPLLTFLFLTYKNLMYLKLNIRPCDTHGWIKLNKLYLKNMWTYNKKWVFMGLYSINESTYPYIPA